MLTLDRSCIRSILEDLHPDMNIDIDAESYILHLLDLIKDSPFPDGLERHIQHEQDRYLENHPETTQDELILLRQQCLVAEILEAAGIVAKNRNKYIIEKDDIFTTIKNDMDLNDLFLF